MDQTPDSHYLLEFLLSGRRPNSSNHHYHIVRLYRFRTALYLVLKVKPVQLKLYGNSVSIDHELTPTFKTPVIA